MLGSIRGSGILSSAADVPGMSVVHGRRGGEWMRLGLGFINPVGTWGVLACVFVWVAVMWVVYMGSG